MPIIVIPSADILPSLERPAFFDGQRLTAADLTATQSFERELRWLHNRALHTWGIAFGLAVTGQRNDRAVVVQSGYALDCLGRDLLLPQGTTLAVPAVAGGGDGQPITYYLTASYATDAELPMTETRAGVCEGDGAVRRPEQLRLRWQNPADRDPTSGYRRGLDVILATVLIQNCRLAAPVSLAERREARPATQPYVAAGATTPGNTAWSFWLSPTTQAPLGVQTTVDTSSAGFGATPLYLAHVVGNRVLAGAGSSVEAPALGQIADGFVHVANPTPTSFDVQLVMPRNLDLRATGYLFNPDVIFDPQGNTLNELQSTAQWYVVWLGLEG